MIAKRKETDTYLHDKKKIYSNSNKTYININKVL